jgi:hypothetical protein
MARNEFGETISYYPTEELFPPTYRPAEIDLSGFKAYFGLNYFFK